MGNGDNRIGFILSSLNFALFLSSSYTRPSTYTFIADLMTRFDNEGNPRLTTIIAAVQKHAVRFSLEKWMFDKKGERESLDGDKTRIRIPNSQHQFPSKPRGNFAPVICISPDFLPYHFLWMIRIGQATREQNGKFDMWIFFSNFRTRRNSFTPYPLPFSLRTKRPIFVILGDTNFQNIYLFVWNGIIPRDPSIQELIVYRNRWRSIRFLASILDPRRYRRA